MMLYFKVNSNCNGCLACVQNCPANALVSKDEGDHRTLLHNMARCARCATCWRVCPEKAIEFQYMLKNQWDEVVSLDIVHCVVCNELLYTADFAKTLSKKSNKKIAPLCSRHREAHNLKTAACFFPGKERLEEVKNDRR
ncbi:MAG: 4Fe-4S dicluster domain-containing protein [Deltaproteobacteria bacterium]|nr:4Fe-4S dicluster domain-containing protein [Deltaproteobacteria bacterium]MBT8357423.1 4Fe-4S dicluster domain-containing protein [Deltaproteobacteria bacterium]MBT8375029.1 4Fe-4S dicluster domain-containing protein [Deltaproteobacteria bacterium]NNK84771.1 4Fe-4S dicluster domain-containing protein [Desulfobacterales bacterium]NNL42961.1 4Fe-4S dicluster domain-containing protein [Desulfobacterales bacterium]